MASHCLEINVELLHVAYMQFGSSPVSPILFSQCSELGPNRNFFQFLDRTMLLPLRFGHAVPSLEHSSTPTSQTLSHALSLNFNVD